MANVENSRMTLQRKIILKELKKMHNHPTAAEIYKKVKDQLPRISLGTVYRNLEFLNNSGQIQKLDFGENQSRFDGDTTDHYHAHCIKCSSVTDIPHDPLLNLDNKVHTESKFRILDYNLDFIGICQKCDHH